MSKKILFNKFQYHPVLHLPKNYVVLDLTGKPPTPVNFASKPPYSVGRYNECRPTLYTQDLFTNDRNIHVGIDLGAPTGEPVFAFFEGEIFLFTDNTAKGDYGPTLITRHQFDDVLLFALYGHLSRKSLFNKTVGEKFRAGDCLGWLGDESENGGWSPHLHFQLSYKAPLKADLSGVVSAADLPQALEDYPDPRLVLGPLY